ncbi:MAG TPA: M1 family aminopeptidase [Bacteroidota bacterium]
MHRLLFAVTVIAVLNIPGLSQETRYRAPLAPPRAHYTIECNIDVEANTLSGVEVVRFRNTSSSPMGRIAFDWEYVSFRMMKATLAGEQLTPLSGTEHSESSGFTVLQLPSPASPGSQIELRVEFSRSLSDVPRSVLEEQKSGEGNNITLTDWHPRLSWGFPTHDAYDVDITATPGYTIAASGRYNTKGPGYFHVANARSFGLFLGKGLLVSGATAGDVQIRCLYTARGEEAARLILATTVDAVNFYRQFLGFYPTESITIVPGFDFPAGGYPIATALAAVHGQERFSERPPIHWQWITAHEIGHMYWGEYVLDNDYPLSWLTIGLGIYTDREFIRSKKLSLEKYDELMKRYSESVLKYLNTTVDLTPEQVDELEIDYNNVVVHGKGYGIISALATVVGKESFERILRRTQQEYGGKRLDSFSFRALCESESGQDLEWFFDQWLRSNKYLSYEIISKESVKQGATYRSTVKVKRVGTLSMPVIVGAYFQDGSHQLGLTDRLLETNILSFESASPLMEVQLDPNKELPLVAALPEKPITSVDELSAAISRLPWKNPGTQALAVYQKTKELNYTGANPWAWLGLKLFDSQYYAESLDAFRRGSAVAAKGSPWEFGSLVWQGHLLDLLGKREEALEAYRKALAKEGGNALNHGQYGMVVNKAWVEKRLAKPFLR